VNKRGLIITFVGLIIIFVSLIVAISAVPSNISESDIFLVSSLFEGMFDYVSEPLQIMPGNIVYTSYSTSLSDIPLLWVIQIIDYKYSDKLSINVSNIFDDSYGELIQDDSILFNTILIEQSDTLNFKIENIGTRTVDVIVMFSEDPENSNGISNSNSPMMDMILPLMISGFLIILGIIITIIGVIIMMFDLKNKLDKKRNY
jgi:uncharacterized membrane protein